MIVDEARTAGPVPQRMRFVERNIGQGIAVGPFHRCPGQAEIGLEMAEGCAAHILPPAGKIDRQPLFQRDARCRRPGAGRARRADMGWPIARVDGDAGARALRQQRRGHAQRTGTDHADVAIATRQRLLDRDAARSPGKGPAAAAMAIIVDDQMVAHPFRVEARPGGTERAQTGGDAKDTISLCPDDRKGIERIIASAAGQRAADKAFAGGSAARDQTRAAQRRKAGQEGPATAFIHHRLRSPRCIVRSSGGPAHNNSRR